MSRTKVTASTPTPSAGSRFKVTRLLLKLGPGLITGAADDDPSGIATYSQVGAKFGYGMLWVMPFSYPLMAVIQEISARIGRVTGAGIAANIRRHYPKPILYAMVSLLLVANIFNLGADIGAMGASAKLFLPGPAWTYILLFGGVSLSLQIAVPYTKYVPYLKWLTLALFAYIATAIVVGEPKWQAIRATFWPSIHANGDYFTSLIAVFGTTISPYLFFWQASQEAQDVSVTAKEGPLKQAPEQAERQFDRIKTDTYIGMAFSNIVAFFIILTAAVTLHAHGILDIQTADQAAKALEPLAGGFAFVLFATGIIGTGLLAVPVLAGSAAYAVGEAFQWTASLEKKPRRAIKFYATIGLATVIGLLLNFVHLNPIKALFWSAVLNGIVAVPVMIWMMILTQNPKVMGKFTLPLYLRIGGWIATVVMLIASLGMLVTLRP
ncbi:MAG TPA: divalent metal cation transporter [Candidatus Acidoferrales bacterium]|jgi:NRAMP (natural resistance-associated macrophage protein)-like metal ion transporter|nr:divalent metal cation transporter [Candidatus Acidoferrales bacterium]